jgi:hypothetical protein
LREFNYQNCGVGDASLYWLLQEAVGQPRVTLQ